MKIYRKNAQSLLEYALLAGIVTVAFLTMGVFMRRGIQSVVKVTADQLAPQNMAEKEDDITKAHLEESYTATRGRAEKLIREVNPATVTGSIEYRYAVDGTMRWETDTKSNTTMNMGYTNQSLR